MVLAVLEARPLPADIVGMDADGVWLTYVQK